MDSFHIKKSLQRTGLWLGILLPVFMIFTKESAALEIFKWVDRQGVTYYSSEPPPGWVHSTQILNITPPARSGADQPDERVNYAKWLEMAKVLEQSRLARERLRLAKARLRMEAAAGQQTVPQDTRPVVEYRRLSYPLFYPRHRRHYPRPHQQGRSHYRPKETHALDPKSIWAYK